MEYIERLEKTLDDLERNSGKLSNLPELVKGISELIDLYRESNSSTEKSQQQLDAIADQLKESCEELLKALKTEQETKDELLNTIRTILTANNKEQLDAVNSVTSVVNNKIAIVESNIEVKTNEIDNNVKKTSSKVDENGGKLDGVSKDVSSVSEKIGDYGDRLTGSVDEIKSVLPIIKRTQMIAMVAAGLALLACVLSVIM
jgi:chromosome segregation ATPase